MIWIPEHAIELLQIEADRCFPSETGGMLVGYRSSHSYVITQVIGPGPAAVHTRTRFEPDAGWQFGQLDQAFAQSAGFHRYLGDWHTHPDAAAQLSFLDRRTLARISAGPKTGERHPLMLIGGGSPKQWHWIGHVHVGTFARLWARTRQAEFRLFSAELAASGSRLRADNVMSLAKSTLADSRSGGIAALLEEI
jgi:integrative and conjugative element protein (TIGR02256 family)